MKKTRIVFCAVLAAVLAFCLAACGDKGGGDGMEPPAPDFDKMKSERVTAEQWAAAFDLGGVTNMTFEYLPVDPADKELYKIDGNKVYCVAPLDYTEMYCIYEGENAGTYKYLFGEYWVREPNRPDRGIEYWIALIYDVISEFAVSYGQFTYDEDRSAYVSNNTHGEADGEYLIKIINGKFAFLRYFENVDGELRIKDGLRCYNYGTTKVSLPDEVAEKAFAGRK